MSDVLISGMEMPKEPTPITLYPDGRWGDYTEGIFGTFVSIPTPYGRLIDADALVQKLEALIDTDRSRVVKTSWSNAMIEFREMVWNAPTIMEAEGVEE